MIDLKRLMKLADGAHSMEVLRSVVFDGKSAIVASQLDWIVGIPCPQPHLTAPVVVPIRTLKIHMNKGRDLVVHADKLSNSRGLETALNAGLERREGLLLKDYAQVLDLMPARPEGEGVSFQVGLNEVDRTLIAAGKSDIRGYLNGLLFDLSTGALVGCDGHRLHAFKSHLPKVFAGERAVELIIPRAPLEWMLASSDEAMTVQVWGAERPVTEWFAADGLGAPKVLLRTGDTFVWVPHVVEGKYPDWRRVVPSNRVSRPVVAKVNPVQLADAASATAKTCKEMKMKWPSACLDLKGGTICADGEAATGGLPVGVELSSTASDWPVDVLAHYWVNINPLYLQDLADCVTADAVWSLAPAVPQNEPILVELGDFVGVIQPCQGKVNPAPNEPYQPRAEPVEARQPEAEPEEVGTDPEPCPAAVAAVAAQLVGRVQEAAKVKTKGKGKAQPKPVPVPA